VLSAGRSWRLDSDAATRLSGLVEADEVALSAPFIARLEKFHVEEGDRVEAGQRLATLDTRLLDAKIRSHRRRIGALESRLRQAKEDARLEAGRLEERVLFLERQLKALVEQRAQAREQAQRLRAEASPRRRLEGGVIVREERGEDWVRAEVAEARVLFLDGRAQAMETEIETLRAARRRVGEAGREFYESEALIEQERALLEEAAASRAQTEIRAPRAGIVSLRPAIEGQVLRLGEPVIVLSGLDPVWVRAAVSETVIGAVAVGQQLAVELPGGKQMRGAVTWIAPEAEFATRRDVSQAQRDIRTFAIKVRVPNPNRRLHPGMSAFVVLPRDSR
jgi:HlyD family secretion protein